MERNHVHRLVVVADDDDALPVGVISTSDLVRALASETR
jgi:CBS domain-containing protein